MRNAAHRTAVQRALRTHSSVHCPAQKTELFLKDVLMFVMERHEPEFPENSNNSPEQNHTQNRSSNKTGVREKPSCKLKIISDQQNFRIVESWNIASPYNILS